MTVPNPSLFQTPPSIYTLPKLRNLPLREQPAYRITTNASGCSLPELLAALIGGEKQIEIAEALLAHFKGDLHSIYHAHPAELVKVKGVSQATAIRIAAGFHLGLRLNLPTEERPTINSPADAAALVQHEMGLLEQEHLRVFLLNTRNHVLDIVEIYKGSVNSSQVRIAEVMRPAIQRMAVGMIVCHNHPSQDPTPSPDDVAVTRAMVQAAKLLDIDVLDHLIICQHKFVSLKERGLGFS